MKKVVVFEKGIESVAFFSLRIADYLKELGYEIFVYELERVKDYTQVEQLKTFCKDGDCFVITFNFNGIRGEEEFEEDGQLIWKKYQVPMINIMVDHPFYYPKLLDYVLEELGTELYYQIAIDKDHLKFMERFYPKLKGHVEFLPLAGTETVIPVSKKEYGVTFVGNYTPPERFREYIERIDDEYTAFYEGIINDLIEHPGTTMEEAFEKHLKREMGEISDTDLRTCMGNMIFIDLYVRYHFRGDVVKTLAEAGIPVHIWGSGFDLMDCKCPENIIMEGATDSAGCLLALAKSKVALNVMPWFKDGAHDRIYSAMLNHAVCFTDDSKFLREDLKEGEEVLFFSLEDYSDLPERIQAILLNSIRREEIAEAAYVHAKEKHTWKQRTDMLLTYIDKWFH